MGAGAGCRVMAWVGMAGLAGVVGAQGVRDVIAPEEAAHPVVVEAPEPVVEEGEVAPMRLHAVAPPEVYAIVGREVAALEAALTAEIGGSLSSAEQEMLDLDIPLPGVDELADMQMDIDERFGRLQYMARALKELATVESARDEYRTSRHNARVNALNRVVQGLGVLEQVRQGDSSAGLDLVGVRPAVVGLSRQPGVYALDVIGLGRAVSVDRISVAAPVRGDDEGRGLVVRNEGCTVHERVLRLGDRCAVVVEWDGVGAVPEGVIVVGVAAQEGTGARGEEALMVQNHVVRFGLAEREVQATALRAEVREIDAQRQLELDALEARYEERLAQSEAEKARLEEEIRAREAVEARVDSVLGVAEEKVEAVAARVEEVELGVTVMAEVTQQLDALQREVRELREEGVVAAVDGSQAGESAAVVSAVRQVLEGLEARVAAVEEGASGASDAVREASRSLPDRVHVVSARGIGEAAVAVLQLAQPASESFDSGRMRVRIGDSVGSGWTVKRVDTAGSRVLLEHAVFGEGVATPRIFLPPAPSIGDTLVSDLLGDPGGAGEGGPLPVIPPGIDIQVVSGGDG